MSHASPVSRKRNSGRISRRGMTLLRVMPNRVLESPLPCVRRDCGLGRRLGVVKRPSGEPGPLGKVTGGDAELREGFAVPFRRWVVGGAGRGTVK